MVYLVALGGSGWSCFWALGHGHLLAGLFFFGMLFAVVWVSRWGD